MPAFRVSGHLWACPQEDHAGHVSPSLQGISTEKLSVPSCLHARNPLCLRPTGGRLAWSTQATLPEDHRPQSLTKKQTCVSHIYGGWKSQIRARVDLVFGEDLLPGSQTLSSRWAPTWRTGWGSIGGSLFQGHRPMYKGSIFTAQSPPRDPQHHHLGHYEVTVCFWGTQTFSPLLGPPSEVYDCPIKCR